MPTERSKTWSLTDDVLPFVAMLMITCSDISIKTLVKAAMNGGMKSNVYVVYHNALGTMILLPFFVVHMFRNTGRPPLSFHLLFRFFILGLLGSPTLASAITNMVPGNTFLLAVVFRMEKIDIRSSSSVAKLLGTMIAISGVMVFTFYQGPETFQMIPSPDSPNQLLLPQPSDWVFGGLILVLAGIFGAIWHILQTATAREYPDRDTIVFFYCLFGTITCIAIAPFLEPNPRAWVLQPGIEMIAIICGAIFSLAFRSTAATWCLKKKGPIFVTMFMPLSIVIAVIMGITFLGDSLHLGSTIGAAIISVGFYLMLWGQAKEKNKLLIVVEDDLNAVDDAESSNHTVPLLIHRNESKC